MVVYMDTTGLHMIFAVFRDINQSKSPQSKPGGGGFHASSWHSDSVIQYHHAVHLWLKSCGVWSRVSSCDSWAYEIRGLVTSAVCLFDMISLDHLTVAVWLSSPRDCEVCEIGFPRNVFPPGSLQSNGTPTLALHQNKRTIDAWRKEEHWKHPWTLDNYV